jgi:hypothetical protein
MKTFIDSLVSSAKTFKISEDIRMDITTRESGGRLVTRDMHGRINEIVHPNGTIQLIAQKSDGSDYCYAEGRIKN